MRLQRVRDPQLAPLFEQEDTGGRELFGNRPESKLGRGGVGDPPLDIRLAVTLAEDHVLAARDEHGSHELLGLDLHIDGLVNWRDRLRVARRGDQNDRGGSKQRLHGEKTTLKGIGRWAKGIRALGSVHWAPRAQGSGQECARSPGRLDRGPWTVDRGPVY